MALRTQPSGLDRHLDRPVCRGIGRSGRFRAGHTPGSPVKDSVGHGRRTGAGAGAGLAPDALPRAGIRHQRSAGRPGGRIDCPHMGGFKPPASAGSFKRSVLA